MTDLPPPIRVSGSQLPDVAASNLRMVLVSVGAYAAGRGWFTQSEFTQLLPVAMIIVPWVWGQVSRFAMRQKLISVVSDPRTPDSVGTLK